MQQYEQPIMPTHGFAEVVWEHASLPDRFWNEVQAMPSGCWITKRPHMADGMRKLSIQRLKGINPVEAWAIVPTCGSRRCANPAHICVTMATPLSTD
jgi:hypothetical protein